MIPFHASSVERSTGLFVHVTCVFSEPAVATIWFAPALYNASNPVTSINLSSVNELNAKLIDVSSDNVKPALASSLTYMLVVAHALCA